MSDPLALRVAQRFLKRAGPHDQMGLLHDIEASAHRASEMLHALSQAHGFWERSIVESKPLAETAKAYRKMITLLKSYEGETEHVMGSLEEYEHLQGEAGDSAVGF